MSYSVELEMQCIQPGFECSSCFGTKQTTTVITFKAKGEPVFLLRSTATGYHSNRLKTNSWRMCVFELIDTDIASSLLRHSGNERKPMTSLEWEIKKKILQCNSSHVNVLTFTGHNLLTSVKMVDNRGTHSHARTYTHAHTHGILNMLLMCFLRRIWFLLSSDCKCYAGTVAVYFYTGPKYSQ